MTTRAEVEDTYAEAFRSIYAEVLVTATLSLEGPALSVRFANGSKKCRRL